MSKLKMSYVLNQAGKLCKEMLVPSNTIAAGKICFLAVIGSILPMGSDGSNAAQGNIPFVGDVTNNAACLILVQRDGILVPNPTATQLNSKLAGGQSGIADIYSLWRYDVSVSGPFVFTSRPVGGDNGVTFTTLYSGQSLFNGLNFSEQPGSTVMQTPFGFSATRLNVNLIADRPDSFPTGTYQAHTTVRCE